MEAFLQLIKQRRDAAIRAAPRVCSDVRDGHLVHGKDVLLQPLQEHLPRLGRNDGERAAALHQHRGHVDRARGGRRKHLRTRATRFANAAMRLPWVVGCLCHARPRARATGTERNTRRTVCAPVPGCRLLKSCVLCECRKPRCPSPPNRRRPQCERSASTTPCCHASRAFHSDSSPYLTAMPRPCMVLGRVRRSAACAVRMPRLARPLKGLPRASGTQMCC